MRLLRLLLIPFAILEPIAWANVADLRRSLFEADLRDGQTVASLARELRVYYPSPADKAFLNEHLPAIPRVKARAFERLPDGYRLTLPDGRVATFTRGDGDVVTLNTIKMPEAAAGLRVVFAATERALGPRHASRGRWFELPRAEAASVDLTNAVVMLSVFTVTVLQKSPSRAQPQITDLINHGVEICELENFENLPFEQSTTSKLLNQLGKISLVDYARASSAEACQAKIKDTLAKDQLAAGDLGVSEADLMNGCVSAAHLATCVREYRWRKMDEAGKFAPETTGSVR